jgi:ComF family protein
MVAGIVMPALRRVVRRVPTQCEVCRGWQGGALCTDCRQRFAPPRPRCLRCAIGLSPAAEGDTPTVAPLQCGACLRDPPPFASCFALADYGFPWDRLVARLKFSGHPELADGLAQAMAEHLLAGNFARPTLILPIPLGERRLRERGYNQSWELARRLAERLDIAADPKVLLRLRETARQTGLSRTERHGNLHDAFLVDPRAASLLRGRHVALLDDVMSSGATAAAAARATLRAGADRVDVWLLARTPMPQDRG